MTSLLMRGFIEVSPWVFHPDHPDSLAGFDQAQRQTNVGLRWGNMPHPGISVADLTEKYR